MASTILKVVSHAAYNVRAHCIIKMLLNTDSRLLTRDNSAGLEQLFVSTVNKHHAPLKAQPIGSVDSSLSKVGIDGVYVIAIDDDSMQKAQRSLARHFGGAMPWPGVLGKQLTRTSDRLLSPLTRHQLNSGYREHIFVPHNGGAVGCYLSHAALWYHILQAGLRAVLVCEHDIDCDDASRLNGDLKTIINRLVVAAGGVENFDVLHLSAKSTNGHGGKEILQATQNGLLRTWGPLQCTQCYIVTKRGAQRLLQGAFPLVLSVDVYLFAKAREDAHFNMLRPNKPLFRHRFSEHLKSTIGYKPSLSLLPVQYQSMTFLVIIGLAILLIILLVVTAVRRHKKRRLETVSSDVATQRIL